MPSRDSRLTSTSPFYFHGRQQAGRGGGGGGGQGHTEGERRSRSKFYQEQFRHAGSGAGSYSRGSDRLHGGHLQETIRAAKEALGMDCNQECNSQQVLAAFRAKAKAVHPDVNDSKDAGRIFLELSESRDILLREAVSA